MHETNNSPARQVPLLALLQGTRKVGPNVDEANCNMYRLAVITESGVMTYPIVWPRSHMMFLQSYLSGFNHVIGDQIFLRVWTLNNSESREYFRLVCLGHDGC